MTTPNHGKLNSGCLELPTVCDVCGNARGTNKHKRCSKIRQARHAQAILNDEFDRMLMFDKKESDDDQTIQFSPAHADASQRQMLRDEG